MTMQRAMWQQFGLRLNEMAFEDFMLKLAMLSAEAEAQRKRSQR